MIRPLTRPKIRLVVFDCDGTLVDSQHAIIDAMGRAFERNGMPAPGARVVRRTVGLSIAAAMAALHPRGGFEARAALVEDYRQAFHELRSRPDHHEPLYDGAAATLSSLEAAGYLLGVATGKSQRGLRATLDRLGLRERFVTLQTADDAPSKPHPGMLENAMAEAGAAPGETVLVGDTTFDIEMAVNAGVAGIGVGWGYHEEDELRAAGARVVIDSFAALPGALAELGGTP